MEALLIPGMIVGGLALFAGIRFMSSQRAKKRREGLQAAAMQLGYQFDVGGESGVPESLGGLHLFNQGRSKAMHNILSGKDNDVAVQIFDYRYVTGSGKNRRTHVQTVLWLQWSQLSLPVFAVRPEHIFHKIGGVFGYQDIDFPTHPQFSKDFLLRGSDETEIRQTFGPVVLDFFERHPGVSAEGGGPDLVFYKASKTEAPEGLRAIIHTGIDLLQRFPRR